MEDLFLNTLIKYKNIHLRFQVKIYINIIMRIKMADRLTLFYRSLIYKTNWRIKIILTTHFVQNGLSTESIENNILTNTHT